MRAEEHLSTFRVAWKPSVNFCAISVQQGDPPSTSVNFPCIWETFHLGEYPLTLFKQEVFCQILLFFSAASRPLSNSANFPRGQETFL